MSHTTEKINKLESQLCMLLQQQSEESGGKTKKRINWLKPQHFKEFCHLSVETQQLTVLAVSSADGWPTFLLLNF